MSLEKQMSQLLTESEVWAVFRMDKNGDVHLHCPKEEDIVVVAEFFYRSPEMHELLDNLIIEYAIEDNNSKGSGVKVSRPLS